MRFIILITALLTIHCSTGTIHIKNNPVKATGGAGIFSVQFDTETSSMTSGYRPHGDHGPSTASGACIISSQANYIVSVLDLRFGKVVENRKTSLTNAVVLTPNTSVRLADCYTVVLNEPTDFEIVYKVKDELKTERMSVLAIEGK